MNAPEELDVAAFEARRKAGETLIVLDVREEEELELAPFPFPVTHVPMTQIPARLAEVPKDRTVVVACHAGVRSERVGRYLLANGYSDIVNLSGGIDAYARRIDDRIPLY